ncbi:MAG: carboxylating nicotinate-nucleotide diphosphorylase [Candidatus Eisenbacteria sp.]|nr:carboxylating nicotinate-nucleotide diphosphorylase [Candidatus Eisenbacteria bacterium]
MNPGARLDPAVIEAAVNLALEEDSAYEDVTTQSIFDRDDTLSGIIVAKAPGVLAGLPVAGAVFRRLDDGFSFKEELGDGERVSRGSVVARCRGRAWAVLSGERVALNFLQRLSGIATMTARYVEAAGDSGTCILDTRKTTPGLRAMEKYGVLVGGGRNHRFSLEDMVLIKDNHIEASGSIRSVVERVRCRSTGRAIEVEVQNLQQLEEVLPLDVDRVMLDNFHLDGMKRAMEIIGNYDGRRPEVEISGGVTLETVGSFARVGADFISVGALTHSAIALDISMEITSC